jgi:hypothetical protein
MLNGNFRILLWVILGGLVQCSHAVALLFCFRYRYLSWAMPVLIVGFLGRISTGMVFLFNQLKILTGDGLGAGPSMFETMVIPGAQIVNTAATVLLDLGLILLLVDVSRQFRMWREAAGEVDLEEDESPRA